jgi:hypothetical protein
LYTDHSHRWANGRRSPSSCLNSVHLTQSYAGIAGLCNQREPVYGSRACRAFGRVGRGQNVAVLFAIEDLADGSEIEGWGASGVEEVVAQRGHAVERRRENEARGGGGGLDGKGGKSIENGLIGISQKGSVV